MSDKTNNFESLIHKTLKLNLSKISLPPTLLLVVVLLALVLLLNVVSSFQKISQQSKALTCSADQCATSTGCQARGYQQEGYVCIGNNQWQGPGGSIITAGLEGPTSTNNLEIAKRVLDWVETQKDGAGSYVFKGACKKGEGQTCDVPPEGDPTAAIFAIWARYNYYKKTGDSSQLPLIIRDIDNIYTLFGNPDNRNLTQSTNWICKILYDVGHDSAFADQQQKLENICQTTWYAGNEMDDIRKKTQARELIPEPEVDIVNQGGTVSYDPVINTDLYLNGFYWYGVTVSNLLSQYRWFNDNSLLAQAKAIFRKALQVYSHKKNDGEFMKEGDAIVGIAALNLYRVTGEQKYLDFVTSYLNNRQSRTSYSLNDSATYLLLLEETNAVSPNPVYSQLITTELANLTSTSFNPTQGAFQEISQFVDFFNVRTNSILASILVNH